MDGGGIWECQACLVHLDFFPYGSYGSQPPAAEDPMDGASGIGIPLKNGALFGLVYNIPLRESRYVRIESRIYMGFTLHESCDLGDGTQTINPSREIGFGVWILREKVFLNFRYKTRWWQLKDFLCSPRTLGKMNPVWRAYFSSWLVQPPTRKSCPITDPWGC